MDNRAALYGPKPEYTELDLDDKDCVIGNYRWLDIHVNNDILEYPFFSPSPPPPSPPPSSFLST